MPQAPLSDLELAKIRLIIPAFDGGKTIPAMTEATDINEDESIEISQDGNSKKVSLWMALKNRAKKFIVTDVATIDMWYADGWYDVTMQAGSEVNGHLVFGMASFYIDTEGIIVQVQFTPDNKIYMRSSENDGSEFTAWKLVGADQTLKLDKSSVKTVGGASDTDVVSQKFVTDSLALKAPLASPTFTGSVVIPTLSGGTEAVNNSRLSTVVAGKLTIQRVTGLNSYHIDGYNIEGEYNISLLAGQFVNGYSDFNLKVVPYGASTIIQYQRVAGLTYSRIWNGTWQAWILIEADQSLKFDASKLTLESGKYYINI